MAAIHDSPTCRIRNRTRRRSAAVATPWSTSGPVPDCATCTIIVVVWPGQRPRSGPSRRPSSAGATRRSWPRRAPGPVARCSSPWWSCSWRWRSPWRHGCRSRRADDQRPKRAAWPRASALVWSAVPRLDARARPAVVFWHAGQSGRGAATSRSAIAYPSTSSSVGHTIVIGELPFRAPSRGATNSCDREGPCRASHRVLPILITGAIRRPTPRRRQVDPQLPRPDQAPTSSPRHARHNADRSGDATHGERGRSRETD